MGFLKQIRADANSSPGAFNFYGPLEKNQLTRFIEERKWVIPEDLFDVWSTLGGMDFFDSEVMLGPIIHFAWQDHLDDYNDWEMKTKTRGKYVLFHEGIGSTMIDQNTLEVKSFSRGSYGCGPYQTYKTCVDWYLDLIRDEYMSLWSLPPPLPREGQR